MEECRICMSQKRKTNFVDIFEYTIIIGNTELYLYDALQELTDVKVCKGDGKPEVICPECETRLHNAYELKVLAEESDKKFSKQTDKRDAEPQKRTIIERYEYSITSKEDEEEQPVKEDSNEEIDAVSFVLRYIPETLAELHKTSDANRSGRKAVDYKDRKHECHVCSKRFLRRSNLIDHLRLHANQRPYECEYCNKTFVQSGNYKSHLRIHTKERPYECKICRKSYNQPSALKVHIRTHTMEKNYVCPVCEKRFTNSSDLSKHKRIHDVVKKYTCNYCSKDFAQNVNLKKHIRNNHKDVLEVTQSSNILPKSEVVEVII
ncbi:zinc finger protein 32-like [Phlebotomus argentipes]|uniref:zinc finger protein 32-like n=1 Tax=Phlebotomus argentipes TaxID=94469 RepID=UPI002892D94D|nr:zinc finger protein 32-like [Phlebotomus argentipes]